MIQLKNYLFILISVLLLCSLTLALSPDEAITLVSKTNNYLLDNETAGILSPQLMIKNSSEDYWIVVAMKDSTPSVYIPVSNKTENVAEGEVTIRNLIETEIVLTKIKQLKDSSYGLNWPFSYNNRAMFDGLANDMQNMAPKVQIVQSTMADVGSSESRQLELLAKDTAELITKFSNANITIAENTDVSRSLEDKYLNTPDTNLTSKYKSEFDNYYSSLDTYKTDYSKIESNLNALKQGIAALQTDKLTQTDKDGLINYLKLPTTVGKLPSFFSQTNQTKTATDSVFSASKNIEGFVLNLSTRKVRNTTWLMLFGSNVKITKVNKSFYSLSEASEAILAADNVDLWEDTASVTALKTNWAQTKTRYANQEYDKAQEFAKKAETNVLDILEKGIMATENNTNNDLINGAIIVLIILVVGLYVYDKFIVKKKKEGEENAGQYNEP